MKGSPSPATPSPTADYGKPSRKKLREELGMDLPKFFIAIGKKFHIIMENTKMEGPLELEIGIKWSLILNEVGANFCQTHKGYPLFFVFLFFL